MAGKEQKVLEIPYLYEPNLKINYDYDDKDSPLLTLRCTDLLKARGNSLQMMI